MPNRSQEENEALILNALRTAGELGLSIDQLRLAVFAEGEKSNSFTKKLLERLKTKGHIKTKMGRSGPLYVIAAGH